MASLRAWFALAGWTKVTRGWPAAALEGDALERDVDLDVPSPEEHEGRPRDAREQG